MNNQKCENCKWSQLYELDHRLRCQWSRWNPLPYIMEDTFPTIDPNWGRKCKVWELKSGPNNE